MIRFRPFRFFAAVLFSNLLIASATQAADSNKVYDTNCSMCHQKAGVGLAGQFPRLAGRTAEIAASEAGRQYLIEAVLFGQIGKIEVDGSSIVGLMPSFAVLSDADVADVLNYLIGLDAKKGKRPRIKAADVSKVRSGPQLSASQVHAHRKDVVTAETQ